MSTTTARSELSSEPWLEIVRTKVRGMRFGAIQIVVHEGRVTQVDCTERTRLPAHRDPSNELTSLRLNPET